MCQWEYCEIIYVLTRFVTATTSITLTYHLAHWCAKSLRPGMNTNCYLAWGPIHWCYLSTANITGVSKESFQSFFYLLKSFMLPRFPTHGVFSCRQWEKLSWWRSLIITHLFRSRLLCSSGTIIDRAHLMITWFQWYFSDKLSRE